MNPRLILSLFLSAALISYGRTMSLKDCITLGLENNLSIINSRIDTQKGHTTVSQNRSQLLPVINGVFQFTDYVKQPVNVTTGTLLGNDFPEDPTWQTIRSMQYNANAGIQLNLPLYYADTHAAINVAKTIERLKYYIIRQSR